MTQPSDLTPDQWLERVRAEYWTRLGEELGEAVAAGPPHVVFQLLGRRFAADARLCKGVVRRPRITRLPGLPPHVLGVAGIRGEVVSATDPAVLLALPGQRPDGQGFLLMLAEAQLKTALWVDRVVDVVSLDPAEILPVDHPWPSAPEGIVLGQTAHGTPPLLMLDGKRYLEASSVGRDVPEE